MTGFPHIFSREKEMFWRKEQILDAAMQVSPVKQSRPGWLFTERTPGTQTTNHSCSAEIPLGDCGFVWQRRDIFQMFLCISSFRKRAAVSSRLKGRTYKAELLIFSCFLIWLRTRKYFKSPVWHLVHLGELMQLSFKNGSFMISYSVFLVSKKRSTS